MSIKYCDIAFNRIFKSGLVIIILLLLAGCKNEAANNLSSEQPSTTSVDLKMGNAEYISEIIRDIDSTKIFEIDSISKFYKDRKNEPIWNDANFRNALLDTLQNSQLQGFYFKDYHGDEINLLLKNLDERSPQELSQLDVLLTDAYFKFGKQLWFGKTDPIKINKKWDIHRKDVPMVQFLKEAESKNDLETALKNLRPVNPIYNQLVNAAKEQQKLISLDTLKHIRIPDGKLIKPGHSDPRIKNINLRLQQLGYLKTIDTSNIHSEKTEKAIKEFQLAHGLMIDGIIGNATISDLNKYARDWFDIVQVNLERWRWYPRDLGKDYILINIADFKLQLYLQGKLKEEHKIVVGLPHRETPVFQDEIENIVLNPSWYVPPTIKNKDVIPGVRKDPGYLNKKHLNVIAKNGQRVDPSAVDWNSKEVYSYQFKQNPGSANPLGVVKINFPNKHLVYLHDTNHKSLFENNARSNSSGCIRVQGAVDLAKLLVSDQKAYSSEKIDELLETGNTRYINLTEPLKINIFYWTAWRENGITHFTHDIYNNDMEISKALNASIKP